MIWILAIIIVVSFIFAIKKVFLDRDTYGCFFDIIMILLLIVFCFLTSKNQKDVTFLAIENSSLSTTFTVEAFEQQISYNRDEKITKLNVHTQ